MLAHCWGEADEADEEGEATLVTLRLMTPDSVIRRRSRTFVIVDDIFAQTRLTAEGEPLPLEHCHLPAWPWTAMHAVALYAYYNVAATSL